MFVVVILDFPLRYLFCCSFSFIIHCSQLLCCCYRGVRHGLEDEWETLHHWREYLISEIDAAKVVSYLREKQVLTADQERTIREETVKERRTETFLDMLEMTPPESYAVFLEAVGEVYPHVYLELSGDDGLDGKSSCINSNLVYSFCKIVIYSVAPRFGYPTITSS